jgi:hypothetical protein
LAAAVVDIMVVVEQEVTELLLELQEEVLLLNHFLAIR